MPEILKGGTGKWIPVDIQGGAEQYPKPI